jgi:type II secretory pathway pseudopilin PulG
VGWAKSAGITEVGRQVPILISAGFTGLGLLVVGVMIVNLSAKAQESQRRQDQADELALVLAAIRHRLEGHQTESNQ